MMKGTEEMSINLEVFLDEFKADWRLSGKAAGTVSAYAMYIREMVADSNPAAVTLAQVKIWLADSPSAETARHRGRAVRAFGKWSSTHDGPEWPWSQSVPLATVAPTPQPTITAQQYSDVLGRTKSLRDRTAIEMLWSTGMRVSELARVRIEHVDVAGGFVTVPRSKTGKPRVVPLGDAAVRVCRRTINGRTEGLLLGMTSHAIQQLLGRLQAPSAHAWRRGWAVQALRQGVSEASVRAAAGWSSGAMVARYTSAVSGELAIAEFRRADGNA